MKMMMEVFFQSIPKIVFEPIAVLGLMGLFTALFLYRKKQSVLYLTIFFSLIFMVAWRVAIQIISERYAEILIYPMTIAAAYFIFQLENIRKIFPKFPEKYVKHIPFCALAVLTMICIGKNLNFNTYSPIMDSCRTVKADKTPGKRSVYIINSHRINQIKYYSGEKISWLPTAQKRKIRPLTPELCRNILTHATAENPAGVVYIFAQSTRKTPVIAAADIGVKEESWTLLTENFFNRRKKNVIRVYRYFKQKNQLSEK